MAQKKEMTDLELLSLIDSLEGEIDDISGSTAPGDRGELMDAYLGERYGNERPGYSQVVTREVYQTVENYKADIAEVFISDDETVRFEPEGLEDIEGAKQATDYINYIFHRKNDGFNVILESLTDGLLQRRGVIKRYWHEEETQTVHDFDNISAEALEVLANDPEIEIMDDEVEEFFDEISGTYFYDGKFIRTDTKGKVVIEAIPPEEFGMTTGAKCIKDARLVRHRVKKTISDLREEGYSEKKLKNLGSVNGAFDTETSPERLARNFDTPVYNNSVLQDGDGKANKEYEVVEAYVRADKDGDGVAELRKVVYIGKTLLEDEEVDEVPFEIWSPIPIAHKAEGLSVADAVMADQKINTTLWRNQLDNQYNLNDARPVVTENQVNMDSLSQGGPGKPIIVKSQNALSWQAPAPFGQHTLSMMQQVEMMVEKNAGSSDATIDPNILNGNTAAGAVSQVLSKRQARVRMVTRVYGEFLRKVFMGVHELVIAHSADKEIFRLRNNFVEVDPRTWHSRKDVSVVVGLGNGNKNEQLFHLQQAFQSQQQVIAGGGMGTLITPTNIYNLLEDTIAVTDKTAHGRYYTEPDPELKGNEGQDQPSVEDQVAMKEVQIKEMEAQLDAQKVKIQEQELALEIRKHEDNNEFKIAELNLEATQQRAVKVGSD